MNPRLCAAVLLSAAAFLTMAGARADTTLRLGQVPSTMKSIGVVPYVIADQKGFFTREHLAVQLVPLEGGTDQMVKRLDAGDVEISSSATPYFIQAVAEGRSQDVAVAAATANPIYSLMVKPDIKSFADLKGKTLGLSLGIDTISISMRKLLAQKGLKDGDYKVKELVGTPVRFDCLKRGECDGVPLGQPEDFIGHRPGLHPARRLDRRGEAFRIHRADRAAGLGEAESRGAGRFPARLRGRAPISSAIPRHRDDVVKTIVATTGVSDKIARETLDALFPARSRRHPARRRARPQRPGAGHRLHGRGAAR